MKTINMLQGSIVAIVTPMYDDGRLDFDSLSRLINFHIDNGTDAIVVAGTTGEAASLDFEEHFTLIKWVVNKVQKRIPVIAGAGANSTNSTIRLTKSVMAAGADAALLVTPAYNKPTQEGLYMHFKAVADSVPIPQILYNVPGRTACDLSPSTVNKLADISNIIGIKDASTYSRIDELLSICKNRLAVFSGEDATAAEAILHGAQGVISVTANVAPYAMHEMCVAALSGARSIAEGWNKQLSALHSALFLETNPIPVKWATQQLGLILSGIRLPLTKLSAVFHDQVRAAMQIAGILS